MAKLREDHFQNQMQTKNFTRSKPDCSKLIKPLTPLLYTFSHYHILCHRIMQVNIPITKQTLQIYGGGKANAPGSINSQSR